MQLKIEHEGRDINLEVEDVVDICDALELFESALLALGYDQARIDAAITFWSQQIKEGKSWRDS